MESIRNAACALLFCSAAALAAPPAAQDGGARERRAAPAADARPDVPAAVELRKAFERHLAADPDAEWAAVAERRAARVEPACAATGVCELTCDCAPGSELLAYRLVKDESAWETVGPLCEAALAREGTRGRALDLLASAGASERARALAERAYERFTAAFTPDHVIALAEAGSQPLWKAAAQRAQRHVRSAALLAFSGDDAQVALLKKAAGAPLSSETGSAALIDAYVAAGALRRLGDDGHWSRLQERVHDEVLRALDDGAIERARDLALGADFCAQALARPARSGLANLDGRLAFHRTLRAGAAAEPDQIFEMIEHAATL